MQYREPEQPTKLIWGKIRRCTIPYIATLDDDDIRFGYATTGIESIDNDRLRELVPVHLNINAMYETRQLGYEVSGVSIDDAIDIYECIQEYLEHWATYMESANVNTPSIPTDDLIGLDAFASYIYKYASHSVNNTFVKSNPVNNLLGIDVSGYLPKVTGEAPGRVEYRDVFIGEEEVEIQQEEDEIAKLLGVM